MLNYLTVTKIGSHMIKCLFDREYLLKSEVYHYYEVNNVHDQVKNMNYCFGLSILCSLLFIEKFAVIYHNYITF